MCAVRGSDLPVVRVDSDSNGLSLAGVKDGDLLPGELGDECFARRMCASIIDDDGTRMDSIEQGLVESVGRCVWVGGGHEDISVQVVGSRKERELSFMAEARKKKNADAVNVAEQDDGVVFGARRANGRTRDGGLSTGRSGRRPLATVAGEDWFGRNVRRRGIRASGIGWDSKRICAG